ncbi:MAG: fibronectin type III domain-containing protein, partial [Planctomycetota bacterium]
TGDSVTEPSAAPTSYIVYTSRNGYGFDNGIEVHATSYTFQNLTPNAIYFFRVAAANAGGISLPSETIAARVTPNGEPADILIINGFDRLDTQVTVRRGENTRNYCIQHALSIAKAGYFFDGASNEAVERGDVDLANYHILDWILGEESTADETLSPTEQQKLTQYLNGGGSLLISGSEIAWDLGAKGTSADKNFLEQMLKTQYVKDSAKTYQFSGLPQTAFENIPTLQFDNGNSGTYNVDYPDVIQPANGAKACLQYPNGDVAAIQYKGNWKLILIAFPLETITSSTGRDLLFQKAIEFLK